MCILFIYFILEMGEEGSGLLPFDMTTTEAGSSVLTVDTITESPQVFLKTTSTNSELQGEVVTYKPSVTTSVEFPYTALTISQLPLSPAPSSVDTVERVTDRTDLSSDLSRLNETEAIMSTTGMYQYESNTVKMNVKHYSVVLCDLTYVSIDSKTPQFYGSFKFYIYSFLFIPVSHLVYHIHGGFCSPYSICIIKFIMTTTHKDQ